MKSHTTARTNMRPQPGDKQPYPLHGEGVWTEWAAATESQKAQARHLDKSAAVCGSLLLVSIGNGRTLRILPPADGQARAAA